MTWTGFIHLVIAYHVAVLTLALLIIPRVARRGLLFGSYVGEEQSRSAEAARLVRRWKVVTACLAVTALVSAYGLALAGHPVFGDRVALVIMLLGGAVLHLHSHFAARRLAPIEPRPIPAAAPLVPDAAGGFVVPLVSFAVCVLVGTASVLFAAESYDALPGDVPLHFGPGGAADAWVAKSFASVMSLPLMALILGPSLALLALFIVRAKRSVRRGTDDAALRAQHAFRRAVVRVLSGVAVLTTALLGFLGVQVVRLGLGETRSLGIGIWLLVGALFVFVFGYWARLVIHHGQGGALREAEAAISPLTDGLADDRLWVLGIFYVNREDPSLFVEKRLGIGYTVNFGNWKAVTLLVAAALTFVALMTLLMVGASR